MSDQEGDPVSPSQCGSVSETEPEIMVSVTLVSDIPASAGLRKPKSKNPGRRTKVLMIKEADLVAGLFTRKSLDVLGMVGYSRATGIVPFTYHHKGRTPKNAASVVSEDDFGVLKRTVHSRSLTAFNIEFQESQLAAKVGI
ncbi:unnamed protein product [Rhizoctonia solani]|uniref:Uncharacterized protein n=1 Tax=Rhizoctonia solani TaxID=456999 RepID=A0A8H3BC01_9AGAM|nr:unnamed protein product [Rhizoctonia solani]